jgi:hypothetical protein
MRRAGVQPKGILRGSGGKAARRIARVALLGLRASNAGKSEKMRRVNAMSTEVLDNGFFAQAQQRLYNPGIYRFGGLGKNTQIAVHAELGMSMNLLSRSKE